MNKNKIILIVIKIKIANRVLVHFYCKNEPSKKTPRKKNYNQMPSLVNKLLLFEIITL